MKSYVKCICELVNRRSGFDIVVKIRAPYSAGKVLSAPHGLCTAAVSLIQCYVALSSC